MQHIILRVLRNNMRIILLVGIFFLFNNIQFEAFGDNGSFTAQVFYGIVVQGGVAAFQAFMGSASKEFVEPRMKQVNNPDNEEARKDREAEYGQHEKNVDNILKLVKQCPEFQKEAEEILDEELKEAKTEESQIALKELKNRIALSKSNYKKVYFIAVSPSVYNRQLEEHKVFRNGNTIEKMKTYQQILNDGSYQNFRGLISKHDQRFNYCLNVADFSEKLCQFIESMEKTEEKSHVKVVQSQKPENGKNWKQETAVACTSLGVVGLIFLSQIQ